MVHAKEKQKKRDLNGGEETEVNQNVCIKKCRTVLQITSAGFILLKGNSSLDAYSHITFRGRGLFTGSKGRVEEHEHDYARVI